MKKTVWIILCVILAAAYILLPGCQRIPKEPETEQGSGSATIRIVATNFPLYDFARAVCGKGSTPISADVTMLLAPGMETHSYEPTPQDIIRIQDCDLFLYIGGESDEWVEEILSSMDQPVHALRLMDFVNLLEEEGEEEDEYDEHIWTSPVNAIKMLEAIRDEVCEIVNAKQTELGIESYQPIADMYAGYADAYINEIRQLDQDFRDLFAETKNHTVFFGDRFPLLYFVKEYGLSYYAAFPGCYEGSEPSAADITGLIDEAKALSVNTIYYIELSNHQIADVIADSTGASTAMIHSCHNVSQEDFNSGATYLDLMRGNLETSKATLE